MICCRTTDHHLYFTPTPPNTTHLTQPLDKGTFGPLKIAWREAVHDYLIKNSGMVISRHKFSPIFCEAWFKSMTQKNVLSGFRTTRVYPLNRDTIDLPGDDVASNLCQKIGLPYIPLYTPVKQFIPDGVAGSPRFSQSELLACKFEQYYDDKQGCDDLVTSRFHFPTGTHLHTLPVRNEITSHINLIEHDIYKLHKCSHILLQWCDWA